MSSERPKVVLVNRCIVENDESGKVLLVRRSDDDSHNAGKWEFPGGKLETGQDLRSALEREVLEETGILVDVKSRLAFVFDRIITDGAYTGSSHIAIFGLARAAGGALKLSHEHSAHAWELPKEALEYDLTIESRQAIIVLGQIALDNCETPTE